jgi:hypothetical protein
MTAASEAKTPTEPSKRQFGAELWPPGMCVLMDDNRYHSVMHFAAALRFIFLHFQTVLFSWRRKSYDFIAFIF